MESTTNEQVYERVPLVAVPNGTWLAAMRALYHCERDLGLSLRIAWVRVVSDSIANAVLSMGQLLDLVAYEARAITSWDKTYRPRAFRTSPFWGRIGWYFNDGEMLIRIDLSVEEVIKTVAHESFHIHESQRYRPAQTPAEHAGTERRAEEYAQRTWAKLTGATR